MEERVQYSHYSEMIVIRNLATFLEEMITSSINKDNAWCKPDFTTVCWAKKALVGVRPFFKETLTLDLHRWVCTHFAYSKDCQKPGAHWGLLHWVQSIISSTYSSICIVVSTTLYLYCTMAELSLSIFMGSASGSENE